MLNFEGTHNISKEILWKNINTFPMVKFELFPIFKMTYPKKYKEITFENFPINDYVSTRVILLLGFILIETYKTRHLEVNSGISHYQGLLHIYLLDSIYWVFHI